MKHIKLFEEQLLNGDKWTVNSAKRQDGYVFNVGDSFTDTDDHTFEIHDMYISDEGDLMAYCRGGGQGDVLLNLWDVKVEKYNDTDHKSYPENK